MPVATSLCTPCANSSASPARRSASAKSPCRIARIAPTLLTTHTEPVSSAFSSTSRLWVIDASKPARKIGHFKEGRRASALCLRYQFGVADLLGDRQHLVESPAPFRELSRRPWVTDRGDVFADKRVKQRLPIAEAARQIDRVVQQFARAFGGAGAEQRPAEPAQNPAVVDALAFAQGGEGRIEQAHCLALGAKDHELDV